MCVYVYVGVRVSVRLCGGYVFVSICAQTAYSTHKALRHAYNLSDRKYWSCHQSFIRVSEQLTPIRTPSSDETKTSSMEKKLVKTQPKEWSQNMEYHIRESDVDALWPSLTFFKKMKKQNKKKQQFCRNEGSHCQPGGMHRFCKTHTPTVETLLHTHTHTQTHHRYLFRLVRINSFPVVEGISWGTLREQSPAHDAVSLLSGSLP